MNDIIKILFEAVIMIAVILVVRYLIPLIKSKIGSDNYEDLIKFIELTVRAAKQTLDSNGEKRLYVQKQVEAWLKEHKIDTTLEQIDALIEGVYNRIKIEDKAKEA